MATTNIPLPKRTTGFTFGSGNQGLYFNKFFNQWTREFSETNGNAKDHFNGKMSWIMSHVHHEPLNNRQCHDDKTAHSLDKSAGNQTALYNANKRIAKLCDNLQSTRRAYITTGPFVTGMGLSHPIENGFLWHHTLGVPYLPGSSIKGMIRAWLRDWCQEDGELEEEIARLFGRDDKHVEGQAAGNIIIFDALPLKPVELYAEVLTPHDGGWRISDKQEENPPADWISPVPIAFLAVKEGAEFQFALAAREGADDGDLKKAWDYLDEALEWIGAGAKTAVGFGRFEDAKKAKAKKAAQDEEWRKQLKVGDEVIWMKRKMRIESINEETGKAKLFNIAEGFSQKKPQPLDEFVRP